MPLLEQDFNPSVAEIWRIWRTSPGAKRTTGKTKSRAGWGPPCIGPSQIGSRSESVQCGLVQIGMHRQCAISEHRDDSPIDLQSRIDPRRGWW